MKQLLLTNAYVITMNKQREAYERGDILIEGNKIKAIGKSDSLEVDNDVEMIDCSGKIVMPGLINTHVHSTQQLGRGLADDVDLLTWLRKRTWPYESSMSKDEQYVAAKACMIELIKSGVTSFAESGGFHVDSIGKAVQEMGLRCALARSTMDAGEGLPSNWVESTEETLGIQKEAFNKWHNKADGRIKYWFAVRTIFNATEDLLIKTKDIADQLETGLHMHVAEIPEELDFALETTGHTTVEYLNEIGILDRNLLAAHTVWLSDREIDLFRLHDVKASHNAAAAMRVLGFAKIPEMLAKGITVSIGTDGAPCNNRMDMIDEMNLTALIHKGRKLDPKVVPAEQVLEMATINGAKTILQEDITGSLEVGKRADLIVINPNSIGSMPVHDPVSNLVYAMHSSNVESTMCDGEWLMKDREVLVTDEQAVLKESEKMAATIREKAGIQLPDRFHMVK